MKKRNLSNSAFNFIAKVCRVEARLKIFNKQSYFPEEINRTVAECISDYHISTTEVSRVNLFEGNILNNKEFYNSMSMLHNPYGNGTSCEKIVNFIRDL